MKYPLLAITLLALTACSNNPGPDPVNQAETIAKAQERAWFCQMNELGTDWDCVQDAELARNPKPDRLPGRKPAAAESSGAQVEDTSPTQEQNLDAPAPAAAQPETTQPPPADVPTHIALSYRPAQPVALLDLPADYYAVQLVAVSSKKDLEEFAAKHQIRGMSAARTYSQNQLYYILLLGVYETYDNAELAADSLGPPFDETQPWIRPVGSLQRAIKAADEFSGSSEL
jgi:septal ring-binding cell division protein DamX